MKNRLNKIKEKIKNIDKVNILLLIIESLILTFIILSPFLINKWFFIVWLAIMILWIIVIYINKKVLKWSNGNGVIFGNRGKGKGLILNYLIRYDKTKPFSNVPYGEKTEPINVGHFFNALEPNTLDDFINDTIKLVDKTEYMIYEGRNIYLDDVNVYFGNWADNKLKKDYPTMAVLLAITRHLFNNKVIITTQSADRPYKILRELQTDFGLKADGSIWFNKYIPFLRHLVYTSYIYYENVENDGKLPFEAPNIMGEATKPLYLTAGTATKKHYEAMNGKIRRGRLLQLKRKVNYDTRYFHTKVFGIKAPTDD